MALTVVTLVENSRTENVSGDVMIGGCGSVAPVKFAMVVRSCKVRPARASGFSVSSPGMTPWIAARSLCCETKCRNETVSPGCSVNVWLKVMVSPEVVAEDGVNVPSP